MICATQLPHYPKWWETGYLLGCNLAMLACSELLQVKDSETTQRLEIVSITVRLRLAQDSSIRTPMPFYASLMSHALQGPGTNHGPGTMANDGMACTGEARRCFRSQSIGMRRIPKFP